ncbi:PAS domain-containing protein [Mycolicibacterium goodii]|uniref:Histidine kinase n=1 Tax=Mycolicibacterium goodii TaxID=134601 RepID=A0A0K0X2W2_MYCGD|nr:histidine kinase [Mycolicibacterium goodii]
MTETDTAISPSWLAQAVVAASSEAIVVTDKAGDIVLWNDGATRIFGFSAADALGQSLDLIIPEKLRDRHWKGYHQTMATGITKYGDSMLAVPATHQDGRRLSIEFSVALLRDDAGEIVGISAIMREVSERRAAERALHAKIAELQNELTEARAGLS